MEDQEPSARRDAPRANGNTPSSDRGFHEFLEGLPLPAWAVGESGGLDHANAAWIEFTGRGLDVQLGDGWLDSVLAEDRASLRHAYQHAINSQVPFTIEFQARRSDGQFRWLTCFSCPYSGSDGEFMGVLGMCMDLTERRQREEQLAFMATHDSLTGLPNRRMFDNALERAVQRARRGEAGMLLLLDLDNFKSYNDAHGHLEGDQALINFSLLLQRHLRAGDLLARIGGDEFAVLLERTMLDEAQEISDRMRGAAAKEDFVSGARRHELGMSAGLVPIDGRLDARALVDVADAAMYEAKETGRNKIVVRTDSTIGPTDGERMASRVRDALGHKRFMLHYQPVIRLADGSVAYFESLARMIDADGSLLMPGEFLTTIERLGLMPRLTRIVVGMLLQALVDHPSAVVSMNIAGGDLGDESLPRFVEQELRRRNIDGGRMAFEMSESCVVTNLASARYWIKRLHPLGCRFVLDDFGAGLGLFGLLRELDFDQVKLDGSIVRALSANGESRQFVSAVRSLVESQGRTAVASWVETEGLLQGVRDAGFTLGQGYHLEMPDPDLGELIRVYGKCAPL
ncbi:MAG: EAL domain-containing protein [Coriobacteriia bacterium]|nr:EAL domain-containing protein [Coriobacteriia bacterium]